MALDQMRAVDFLHTGALAEEMLFPGASCSVTLGFECLTQKTGPALIFVEHGVKSNHSGGSMLLLKPSLEAHKKSERCRVSLQIFS